MPALRLVALLLVSAPFLAAAQQSPTSPTPRILTDADYRLAESRLSYRTEPLVAHTVAHPEFLPGNRLWYRDTSPLPDAATTGHVRATYVLVDPATRTVSPAFDHASLAQAIAKAVPGIKDQTATDLHLDDLALSDLDPSGHPRLALFAAAGNHLRCTLGPSTACTKDTSPRTGPDANPPSVPSPDGRFAAFIRNWNLWLHDLHSGQDIQLTRDGVPDFGYSTDNAGWKHTDRAILVWSPDSRHIATFQQDQRKTGTMTILPTVVGHPQPETWRYPLVGDKDVTVIERVLIDVPSGHVTRLKLPPDQHRSTLCDDISCGPDGGWDDVQWAPDSHSLAFVSTSRDHKDEWLRTSDLAGNIRTVFHEHSDSFLESGSGAVNWRYLPASNEFLWFSEQSGWGNLSLYDLRNGQLKNPVTTGEGNVTKLLAVDEKAHRILFEGVGRVPGENPYFVDLFSAPLAGGPATRLSPDPTNHTITLSPDNSTFVDVSSTPTTPQVTTLRDTTTGAELMPVAQQDLSALLATGWHPLTPVTVKARDGKTDLYGYLFLPSHLDPSRKYPLVDYIYPGPQVGSCGGNRAFASAHGDDQALAELGFLVVCIDGIGTDRRSKAFHVGVYAQDPADNTLPDQITAIRQLAGTYPIDLSHIGIWGHSGGGNATATAMLRYPDFFQVGISESGNHDQREYEDDWAEKWGGLEHPISPTPGGTTATTDGRPLTNYTAQANQLYAKNLKGKLFLLHGTMDDNVPLNNTLLLVDALIKANKDFDLLLIPNAHHGYRDASPYVMRRRWDYFVRNLAGSTPPHEFLMTSYPEILKLLAK